MTPPRCHISVGTMFRIIHDIIYVRCYKKGQSIDSIQVLLRRSNLELGVCINDYQVISINNSPTSAEARFYLDVSQGIREIYYVRSNQLSSKILKIERKNLYPAGMIVLTGVSSH